jgi:putative Mg2+ transporter-C (MgtC) family protein
MPSQAELVLRLVVALVLGGVIGLERELTGQAAGLRTHMTVALGAALFGVVSAYSFGDFIHPRADTNYQIDVTRIASNIVTGVGFLGGGIILKQGGSVRGLTTAASMWVTAAVGLAVSLGSYIEALVATTALILALTGLRRPRRWLRRHAVARETVIVHLGAGADPGEVVDALHGLEGIEIRSLTLRREEDGGCVIQADVRGPQIEARLAPLSARRGVVDIDINT